MLGRLEGHMHGFLLYDYIDSNLRCGPSWVCYASLLHKLLDFDICQGASMRLRNNNQDKELTIFSMLHGRCIGACST